MGKKKTLDKLSEKTEDKKYLTQDEVHQFEVAHLERQVRNAKLASLKLEAALAEEKSEKHKLQASNLHLQRQIALQDDSSKKEAHSKWTASLVEKYGVAIDGYNPVTGEIYTNPK